MPGLDRVTITGIDDDTDLSFIDDMTSEFSFVEWGILLSDKRKGSARYPSDRRLAELTTMFAGKYDSNFAAHLCGKLCDRLIEDSGESYTSGELVEHSKPGFFSRLQLNRFYKSDCDFTQINRLASTLKERADIILPLPNDATVARVQHTFLGNVQFLHDRSGGRGIPPVEWPDVQLDGEVGFAGGITGDTLRGVVDAVQAKHPGRWFWLDMETGVRTDDDRLDPKKVRRVLALAAEIIE